MRHEILQLDVAFSIEQPVTLGREALDVCGLERFLEWVPSDLETLHDFDFRGARLSGFCSRAECDTAAIAAPAMIDLNFMHPPFEIHPDT